MKKAAVLQLKNLKLFNNLFKNKIFTILLVAFTAGLILGAVSYNKSDIIINYTKNYFSDFLNERENCSFWVLTFNSFFSALVFLFTVFISGTSLLGIILAPLLIFLRGFLYGNFVSMLYITNSIKGIALNAVFIIPPAIIFVIALIFAAKYSIDFSAKIAILTLPHTAPSSLFEAFKLYCRQYLCLFPLIFISALIDSVLTKSFFSAFDF